MRLRKPDVRGEMVEADGGVNVPLLIEDGAAEPVNRKPPPFA